MAASDLPTPVMGHGRYWLNSAGLAECCSWMWRAAAGPDPETWSQAGRPGGSWRRAVCRASLPQRPPHCPSPRLSPPPPPRPPLPVVVVTVGWVLILLLRPALLSSCDRETPPCLLCYCRSASAAPARPSPGAPARRPRPAPRPGAPG